MVLSRTGIDRWDGHLSLALLLLLPGLMLLVLGSSHPGNVSLCLLYCCLHPLPALCHLRAAPAHRLMHICLTCFAWVDVMAMGVYKTNVPVVHVSIRGASEEQRVRWHTRMCTLVPGFDAVLHPGSPCSDAQLPVRPKYIIYQLWRQSFLTRRAILSMNGDTAHLAAFCCNVTSITECTNTNGGARSAPSHFVIIQLPFGTLLARATLAARLSELCPEVCLISPV